MVPVDRVETRPRERITEDVKPDQSLDQDMVILMKDLGIKEPVAPTRFRIPTIQDILAWVGFK